MLLDLTAALQALDPLATELNLGSNALAEGIINVIDAKMAQAIRTMTTERGLDPRRFAIVAFGGAGPLHAVAIAEELGVRQVLVPPFPGAFAAWGMLQTAVRQDFSVPFYRRLGDLDPQTLTAELEVMESEARGRVISESIPSDRISIERAADMRYVGQEYTLPVPLDDLPDGDGMLAAIAGRFHKSYARRYGHANPDAPAEFVSLRLVALGHLTTRRRTERSQTGVAEVVPHEQRRARFDGRSLSVPAFRRSELTSGGEIRGPAFVDEPTTTTVVPLGWSVLVLPHQSLLLSAL
jgi:N-methylhydantoinase A